MPYTSEKIKIEHGKYDRRIKLTEKQKEEIRNRMAVHAFNSKNGIANPAVSQRMLAREYGVSRRLIVWVLYPNRLEKNKQLRKERGGSAIYYNRSNHTQSMRNTRRYKQKLYLEGKI